MFRFDDFFAELGGFALVDPSRLAEFYHGQVQGRDLLTEFTTTERGEKVPTEGIVVPLLGVAPGFYRIIVRSSSEPSAIATPLVESRGWVLCAHTGKLVLSALGYLARWDNEHPQHRRIEVEPGWYEVEILGCPLEASEGDEDGVYEIVLIKVEKRPTYKASTIQSLSLLD